MPGGKVHPCLERARQRLEGFYHAGWWDRIEHRYFPPKGPGRDHRQFRRVYDRAWNKCHAEIMASHQQNEGTR